MKGSATRGERRLLSLRIFMSQVFAYGAVRADAPLQPVTIARRELGADDVAIDITHCGI